MSLQDIDNLQDYEKSGTLEKIFHVFNFKAQDYEKLRNRKDLRQYIRK